MSYVKPEVVVDQMIAAGTYKAGLDVKNLLIRGALSGAFLGFATTLAITATAQTQTPIVGALLFPVGFVMIVLLGLELMTGSFALLPVALSEGKITFSKMLSNWSWVFIGNLIGSLIYAGLFVIAISKFGHIDSSPVIDLIKKIATAKTLGYAHLGSDGLVTVFVKAILCNWMVTLGVVMALTATTTIGKIFAMWLPILIFFGQGFEHAVVNMFVIPTGMMLGADVTMSDWWLWNEIPVTIGNIIGGAVFTGLALYLTHKKKD
jgi:formate/nitrite transporter